MLAASEVGAGLLSSQRYDVRTAVAVGATAIETFDCYEPFDISS